MKPYLEPLIKFLGLRFLVALEPTLPPTSHCTMNKIEVARRQLGTALSLYLDDRDPVSTHVLACAGMEVADHLSFKAGAHPFKLFRQAETPTLTNKEYSELRGHFANAFKHAEKRPGIERDDRAIFADFSDLQNDDRLFIGWFDFACPGNAHPMESHVFQAWYLALHPSRLQSPHGLELLRDLSGVFPNLPELPRQKQKARLRKEIEKAKKNRRLMGDPLVDRRSLRLGPVVNSLNQPLV